MGPESKGNREFFLEGKVKVGISACLLGETVRWDGGHKHDRLLTGELARYFEWLPVCPEMEIGMGVPREAVQLTGDLKTPRLVGRETGRDWTEAMRRFAVRRAQELAGLGICGFIFKARSPSCGLKQVPVFRPDGPQPGSGLFAALFTEQMPAIPVAEEEHLHDAGLREQFIESVFVCHRRLQNSK